MHGDSLLRSGVKIVRYFYALHACGVNLQVEKGSKMMGCCLHFLFGMQQAAVQGHF
jgi:hypothetical protein